MKEIINPTFPIFFPEIPNDFQRSQTKRLPEQTNELNLFQGKNTQLDYNPTQGIPIVYGFRRVEGPIIFQSLGKDSKFLYIVMLIGEGQNGQVFRLFVDDVPVTLSKVGVAQVTLPHNNFGPPLGYVVPGDRLKSQNNITNTFAWFEYVDGRDGNVRSSLLAEIYQGDSKAPLPPIWQGLSYLVCKFKNNNAGDLFRAKPKVAVDLFGRLVRQSTLSGAGTFNTNLISSSNPVDHLLDYLTNTRYGAGLSDTQLDLSSFKTVSDYITATTVREKAGSSNTLPYLQSNIIVSTENSILDNIKKLTSDFGIILSYYNGKYSISIEKQEILTGFEMLFNESNIISDLQISKVKAADRFNSFTVEYINALNEFEPKAVSEPPPSDRIVSEFIAQDGNQVKVGRFNSDGITQEYIGRQTARRLLRKSRGQHSYAFTATKAAFELSVGSFIRLEYAEPYAINEYLRVISLSVNDDFTVNIEAVTHSNDFYPPFSDIFYEDIYVPSFPPTSIRITPLPIIPAPTDPAPVPGDPGGPSPAPVQPSPGGATRFTMNQIRGNNNTLSQTSANIAWPTLTGGSDWYLGLIYIQPIGGLTWSTPLARDTTTAFQPTGRLTNQLTWSPYNIAGNNRKSFGMVSSIDTTMGTGFGSPATAYTFQQTPSVTYRLQDVTAAGKFDDNSGKYQNLDYLLFTYPVEVGAAGVPLQYGWISRSSDSRRTKYVVDLQNDSKVRIFKPGTATPVLEDFHKLINIMPRIYWIPNPFGQGGGAYGLDLGNETRRKDGRSAVQRFLNASSRGEILCELPDTLAFSHRGTNNYGVELPITYKLFAVTRSSGLPEYLGSCLGTNNIAVSNAIGIADSQRKANQANYRRTGLLGTLNFL
jgi:hypothetical protein